MKSSSSSNHGLNEGKDYTLKIGTSFQSSKSQGSYHVLRYDFKPASIDTNRPAELKIGGNNECTVTFPNVQDGGATTYKGGKKPCTKECVLIIDKLTGEIILERIASNIPLKKSRTGTVDRSAEIGKVTASRTGNLAINSKSNKPSKDKTTKPTSESSTPSTSQNSSQSLNASTADSQHPSSQSSQSSSHSKTNGHSHQQKATKPEPKQPPVAVVSTASSTDSSSSDSSDSDDSDMEQHAEALNKFTEIAANDAAPPPAPVQQETHHPPPSQQTGGRMPCSTLLHSDLQLSDSNSDSD